MDSIGSTRDNSRSHFRTTMTITDQTASAPLLEARALSFARRDEPVFGPLDFALHAGEVVLVEGDNGSGKTTLLRILAAMLRADDGELRLHGGALNRDSAVGEILFLGHQLGLKFDLSVLENLKYLRGLYGSHRGMSPWNAIDGVELVGYEHVPVRQLSAGQKKRAALARLLLVPASIWLLDEPWANLDRHGIRLVNRLLERHLHVGGAALASSHGTVNHLGGDTRRIELSA